MSVSRRNFSKIKNDTLPPPVGVANEKCQCYAISLPYGHTVGDHCTCGQETGICRNPRHKDPMVTFDDGNGTLKTVST